MCVGQVRLSIDHFHKPQVFQLRKKIRLLSCCDILGKTFCGESDQAQIIVDTLRPVILRDVAVRNVERLLPGFHAMDEESERTSSINGPPSIPREI